ncbi:hypothetical protein GO002_15910 [Streptomyces eurocidicus]|uniref:Gram-positive cocci surface proteins LPxTG domain-containing protein n=1 Tax=Streptomyces eurocidicus TaxID=66423 RepID=A0A7W8EZE5_STREU|nr:hypothetical protein [Streptomyces eurocidicus]MBB5117513.1 hypothetical protein [Streptomyces eurocidicus]MBF6053355.1 hypothetical protein [Streptomyces eurocidicus]
MFRSIRRRRRAVSPALPVPVALAASAALAAALVLPSAVTAQGAAARAAEPTPGSSQGGSPGPSAPAGYRVTTGLPAKISVDKKTGNTSLNATIRNGEAKELGSVRLKVVGFEGMQIKAVEGCSPIPAGELPEGSNSGFSCTVDKLGAGQSRDYRVTARFDLGKTGRICLPVTLGDTKTLLWQQGPVHFGTTDTSSDAPDTPLLLGTKNVPSGGAATPGGGAASAPTAAGKSGGTGGGTVSSAPSAGKGKEAGPARSTGGAAPSTSESPGELPRTGSPSALPLAGALAGALLLAGAIGIWATRRQGRRH